MSAKNPRPAASLANLNAANRAGKTGLRKKVTKDVLEFFDDYLTSSRSEFMARMSELSNEKYVEAYVKMAQFVGTKKMVETLTDGGDGYNFTINVHPRPLDFREIKTAPTLDAGTGATEVTIETHEIVVPPPRDGILTIGPDASEWDDYHEEEEPTGDQ